MGWKRSRRRFRGPSSELSSRSPGSQPGSFRTRTVRAGVDNVGGKPATQFYLPKKVKAEYKKLGVPTPTVDEPTAVVAVAVDVLSVGRW